MIIRFEDRFEVNNGQHTPEEAIRFITVVCRGNSNFANVTDEEIADYINKNW